ncbi:hypothetical protein [Bradyrhizobium sp. CCBAU 53415]|uniref:hypothetical protein n=1 Tax=Bradyrhizobium sp. CCBAU 53415 TaxID=1325119 RepID=UPI0023061628|nr:hypothetical protein [Bradyrhizobium sp. CCBAU 53415]MDA9463583.1 hypothetical protein [Bradyrhizobium sp. CCBAU 53415]
MLRRIPAVKWAFTRLRPVPHDGSIDATPVAADVSPVIAEAVAAEGIAAGAIAEAASTDTSEISTLPARDEAEIAVVASSQDDTAISIIAESPPAAPIDASACEDSSPETPPDIEPVVAPKVSVPAAEIVTAAEDAAEPAVSNHPAVEVSATVESIDSEQVVVDAAEVAISSDPLPPEAEPAVTAETSPPPVDVETAPVDAPALVVDDHRSPDIIVDVEPTVDEPCITSADAEVLTEPVPENHFDSDCSTGDAVAIEPAAADIAASVVAEHGSPDAASAVIDIDPAPALESPAPEIRSAPKLRARAAEPADRAALIRQRWAETGIRMWNPRLHGTGEAALNIQGSVGLLPPAPGETMPRYDKLEFKMLGGQIVCEGVIVEAPAQASHRSFTRLAEPGKIERVREPTRERQAALA